MKASNRIVELETGGKVTFTQRGIDPERGFVRVNGRTISGYNFSGKFYADLTSQNAGLVTPSYLMGR